jgi:hypothetical protein
MSKQLGATITNWAPAKSVQPLPTRPVLVSDGNEIGMGFYNVEGKWVSSIGSKITFWANLPNLPKD